MSAGQIRPSTIDGIKRYAKALKARDGLTHAQALDAAARAGGFENYANARRGLAAGGAAPAAYQAYISVPWRVHETKERGQEILAVGLRQPLDALVKPHHLKAQRHLAGFRFAASDHLAHDFVASSQSDARRRACALARTLAFMETTGLRPSAGRSRCYPRGDFGNAVPHHDHSSEWFDPTTKAYVFVDEPYHRGEEHIPEDRLAWADKFGWAIVRPTWRGMYNPDGGCELYLAANKAKGFDLAGAVAALNALPPPFVEADWNGRSQPIVPTFWSPAAQAAAGAPRAAPKPRTAPGPKATVGFRTVLAPRERRRPDARMPVKAHAEVGRLLKSAITDQPRPKGAYKPLDKVRCELDDWVQCEYGRDELSDQVFFDLYYHEHDLVLPALAAAARTKRRVADLTRAKHILAKHYPDCAPVRAMFKSIDQAIAAYQA